MMMSQVFENWDRSLQNHAKWVRQTFPDCGLSDEYIDGLVDEASYGFSLGVKILQTAVALAFFGWLGDAVGSRFDSEYTGIVSIVMASFGLPVAYFLWSKSSPIHEYLIRRRIRRRLRDLPPD